MFWSTVKPMFSNKSVNRESRTLVKGDKILSENLEVAESFNAFFSNIVKKMNMSLDQELLIEADHIEDPVLRIMESLKKHTLVWLLYPKTIRIVPSVLGTYPLKKLQKK